MPIDGHQPAVRMTRVRRQWPRLLIESRESCLSKHRWKRQACVSGNLVPFTSQHKTQKLIVSTSRRGVIQRRPKGYRCSVFRARDFALLLTQSPSSVSSAFDRVVSRPSVQVQSGPGICESGLGCTTPSQTDPCPRLRHLLDTTNWRPWHLQLKLPRPQKLGCTGQKLSPNLRRQCLWAELHEAGGLSASCCCCSVPQLNTLRVTRYVHPHLYMYKCRYTA